MRSTLSAVFVLGLAVPAFAQSGMVPAQASKTVSLSGPRFGLTALPDGIVNELHDNEIDVRPTISQFGWQFEHQFYNRDSGVAAVNEWVVLFGGLDQGVALPSVTWLAGIRTREGTEFGIGPNVSPAGVGLALAAGVTLRAGVMNVPLNVAVVPSAKGARISFLTGFNMRRR